MFENIPYFEEEFLNNHFAVEIESSSTCMGFDIENPAGIDPEDEYVASFWGQIVLHDCDEDKEDIQKVGHMSFDVHLLRDFTNDCGVPAGCVIDDVDAEQGLCVDVIENKLKYSFDDYGVTAYVDRIDLQSNFQDKGIERYIVNHMDRIVWFAIRRKLDLLFGMATMEERTWALPASDAGSATDGGDFVWIKHFSK